MDASRVVRLVVTGNRWQLDLKNVKITRTSLSPGLNEKTAYHLFICELIFEKIKYKENLQYIIAY